MIVNLQFLDETAFHTLAADAAEVGRLINGLIASVQRQITAAESPES